MSSVAGALFLTYQYEKLKTRKELLGRKGSKVFSDKIESLDERSSDYKSFKNPLKKIYRKYETEVEDFSTWTDSLYDQNSKAYEHRLQLVAGGWLICEEDNAKREFDGLDAIEKEQERAYQRRLEEQRKRAAHAKAPKEAEHGSLERKDCNHSASPAHPTAKEITLWFRLQWFFAGSSSLLPKAETLGIILGTVLMVTTLAVMAQAGMLGGSWLLGSTLTSAALWLAAHLGMMSLGASSLIALVVVFTWFTMLCIAELKFSGMFANVLFGFVSLPDDPGEMDKLGSDNTPIHKTQSSEGLFDRTLIGIPPSSMTLGSNRGLFVKVVASFNVLELLLLNGMNKIALYLSPGGDRPSHPFFAAFKWLIHLIFVAITVPFLALFAVVDTLYLVARLVYKDATAQPRSASARSRDRDRGKARESGDSKDREVERIELTRIPKVPTNPDCLWNKTGEGDDAFYTNQNDSLAYWYRSGFSDQDFEEYSAPDQPGLVYLVSRQGKYAGLGKDWYSPERAGVPNAVPIRSGRRRDSSGDEAQAMGGESPHSCSQSPKLSLLVEVEDEADDKDTEPPRPSPLPSSWLNSIQPSSPSASKKGSDDENDEEEDEEEHDDKAGLKT